MSTCQTFLPVCQIICRICTSAWKHFYGYFFNFLLFDKWKKSRENQHNICQVMAEIRHHTQGLVQPMARNNHFYSLLTWGTDFKAFMVNWKLNSSFGPADVKMTGQNNYNKIILFLLEKDESDPIGDCVLLQVWALVNVPTLFMYLGLLHLISERHFSKCSFRLNFVRIKNF